MEALSLGVALVTRGSSYMDDLVEHSPALLELGSGNHERPSAHSDVGAVVHHLNPLAFDPFVSPGLGDETHDSTSS